MRVPVLFLLGLTLVLTPFPTSSQSPFRVKWTRVSPASPGTRGSPGQSLGRVGLFQRLLDNVDNALSRKQLSVEYGGGTPDTPQDPSGLLNQDGQGAAVIVGAEEAFECRPGEAKGTTSAEGGSGVEIQQEGCGAEGKLGTEGGQQGWESGDGVIGTVDRMRGSQTRAEAQTQAQAEAQTRAQSEAQTRAQAGTEAEVAGDEDGFQYRFPLKGPIPDEQSHLRDSPKTWKLHSLIKPLAVQNIVVIIPTNRGFLRLALNLRCRLQSLGSTNVLLWALDAEVDRVLHEHGVPHYFDPKLYSTAEVVGYGRGNGEYMRMMSERPNFWWCVLATGFDMVFLDADVVAFGVPEEALELSADVEAQMDYQAHLQGGLKHNSNKTSFCAGVLYIRSSLKALSWMDFVINSFRDQSPARLQKLREGGIWHDQIALNFLLHDGTKSAILNPTFSSLSKNEDRRSDASPHMMSALYAHPAKVMGGTMLQQSRAVGQGYSTQFLYNSEGYQINLKPVLLHLNGRSHEAKEKYIREQGWYHLDGTLQCSVPARGSPAIGVAP